MFTSIKRFFRSLWSYFFPPKLSMTRDFPLLERKSWSGRIGVYMEYQISFYQATTPVVTPILYPDRFLASGLPPGLSCNEASGLIYGTPTAIGVYGVTITALGPSSVPFQTQSTGVSFVVRSA